MHATRPVRWLFPVGGLLLSVALFLQNVTVAGGYRGVLITALLLTAAADVCFVAAFVRGGIIARIAAIVLLCPTIYVVADFLRRAPGAFD